MQRWGTDAAFCLGISSSHRTEHVGKSRRFSPPPGSTGLFHVAILYPDRARLGDALRRLLAAKIPLEGASDHGVSEALYLRDPDQNGLELYRDRPKEEWPHNADGSTAMDTPPLRWMLLRDAKA